MSELFNIPASKSPRLVWMEKYEIQIFERRLEECGECPETGVEIKRFAAGCGASNYEEGDTEDEAVAAWAKANSVPLWNEEQFKG